MGRVDGSSESTLPTFYLCTLCAIRIPDYSNQIERSGCNCYPREGDHDSEILLQTCSRRLEIQLPRRCPSAVHTKSHSTGCSGAAAHPIYREPHLHLLRTVSVLHTARLGVLISQPSVIVCDPTFLDLFGSSPLI